MTNGCNITIKGDKLLIEVDISKAAVAKAPMSKSGKNKLLASTGGFVDTERAGVKVGLNVTAKA